jgi:hypothetical protein
MSSAQKQSNLFTTMAAKRTQTAYALFGIAAVFAVIALLVGIKYRSEYVVVVLWAGLLALVATAGGAWRLIAESERDGSPENMRLLILAIGGLFGFITVLFLGFGLVFKWWDTITGGWETWQGKDGWRIWACLLAIVGGLILMFISLQLARGDEHGSAGVRRLLYGYNTVLSGLLVLLILIVVNVLGYIPWGPFAWLNTTYPWAKSSIYSLSPQSDKILDSLDKPLTIYVIMPKNDQFYHDMKALLDNCREVRSSIQVRYLSPDLDQEEVGRLAEQYKFGGERRGVLLVYGSEGKIEHRLIKYDDLFSTESDIMTGRNKQPLFKGEIAIISELNTLVLGKEKPTIYFTQGAGEPDLSETQRRGPGDGLGSLKERLESANYTVKGLQFSPVSGVKAKNPNTVVSTRVPDDAFLVVIVAPHIHFEKFAIDALRSYMTSPTRGKLIVYFDVHLNAEKTIEMTGLEPFLEEFDVQVGNDRILAVPDPEHMLAILNQDPSVQRHNPIAAAFPYPGQFPNPGEIAFLLGTSRTVRPKPAAQPGANHFVAETLMIVPQLQQQAAWADQNVQTPPMTLIQELNRRGELDKRFSNDHIPMAVAVTESIQDPAGGPHAFMQSEEKPRLIVFGNAGLVCNLLVDKGFRSPFPYYDLFASCVAWLREKPSNIGIEPKKRDYYALAPDANVSRMVLLPTLLMVVAVIGLGTGVWVVRRR